MGARSLVTLLLAIGAAGGCADTLPEKVALHPGATNVEIVTEPPTTDSYERAGEISAQVVGHENAASLRQAFNMLRNEAAAKGATFVAVEDVSSRAAWDFSGRTVVTLVGTAYRPK